MRHAEMGVTNKIPFRTPRRFCGNIHKSRDFLPGSKVNKLNITQKKAAEDLCISQPRVSALLQGKIEKFRLDSLVDMAHRLDLNVSIRLAS
jgi:hypothetical protein